MSSLKINFKFPQPLTESSIKMINQLVSLVADFDNERFNKGEHFTFDNLNIKSNASNEKVVSFYVSHLYRTTDSLGKLISTVSPASSKVVAYFPLISRFFGPVAFSFRSEAISGKFLYSVVNRPQGVKIDIEYEFDDEEYVPYLGRVRPHPWETWLVYFEKEDYTTRQNIFTSIIADLTAQDCISIAEKLNRKGVKNITDYIREEYREWFALHLTRQTKNELDSVWMYITNRASSITQLQLLSKG